jgi:thiamine biosynthesis lipoprotein
MKHTAWLILVLAAVGAPGCRGGPSWHKTTFLYFDTVCEVQLYCSPPRFAEARNRIIRVFERVTKVFSPEADEHEAPEARELFEVALDVYRRSSGCFDLSVAPLSWLWGFRDGVNRVPEPQEIQAALASVGMDRVRLLPGRLEVPEGMGLDWGAIAKGYGLDRAARTLKELGIARGLINAGGDLYCWGLNPRGLSWQVGISHPREEGYLGILTLSGMGAATTGDYQRFFMREGVRYHHVFDPRTGRPARGKQSVTVVGPQTHVCDALSTACFVSESPVDILSQYPEYGAFLVDAEGEITSLGKEFTLRPWPKTSP